MGRLGRGLDSDLDDDEDLPLSGPGSGSKGHQGQSSRSSEIVVVKSGKRYIVRKTAHGQITELGR